jgi:HSP20 family protein
MDLKSLIPWRNIKSNLPATREDYFDPFVSLRREVDRMFDDFFSGFGGRSLQTAQRWPSLTPMIDVVENYNEVVVSAELPGLSEKDFDVTLTGDVLTNRGEKKAELEERSGETTYIERRYGAFTRTVRLPFDADNEKVDAKYDKGVLTVRVPKPADFQKPVRRIEVKAA